MKTFPRRGFFNPRSSIPPFRQPFQERIQVTGIPGFQFGDFYHALLTARWIPFLAIVAGGYLCVNVLFGWLYQLDPQAINGGEGFHDTFFFSIQTMSTIGYGAMSPASTYGHFLVTLQSLLSLFGLATATGLMFARISRPTARVMFSHRAIIAPHNGIPTLMFRVANQRRNQIVEARIQVTLVRNQVTQEGERMRRLYDLHLTRTTTPIFSLTWTVMHPIEAHSPLFGVTPAEMARDQTEIIITLTGLDDTFNQTIHARHFFLAQEILWNHRFRDTLIIHPDGKRTIDYSHFHQVDPLP